VREDGALAIPRPPRPQECVERAPQRDPVHDDERASQERAPARREAAVHHARGGKQAGAEQRHADGQRLEPFAPKREPTVVGVVTPKPGSATGARSSTRRTRSTRRG